MLIRLLFLVHKYKNTFIKFLTHKHPNFIYCISTLHNKSSNHME